MYTTYIMEWNTYYRESSLYGKVIDTCLESDDKYIVQEYEVTTSR